MNINRLLIVGTLAVFMGIKSGHPAEPPRKSNLSLISLSPAIGKQVLGYVVVFTHMGRGKALCYVTLQRRFIPSSRC